jgi:hypothetical protein
VHTSALAEIDRAAHVLSGGADIEIRGARSGFDDRAFAAVARHPQVAIASPVVEVIAAMPDGGTVRVLGIDAFRAARLQPAFVGATAHTGAEGSGAILDPSRVWLTPAAAAKMKAAVGERVRFASGTGVVELTVGGILGSLEGGGVVAVMDIAAAQLHFARQGSLTRIDVRLKPGADAAGFSRSIAAVLPAGVLAEPAQGRNGVAVQLLVDVHPPRHLRRTAAAAGARLHEGAAVAAQHHADHCLADAAGRAVPSLEHRLAAADQRGGRAQRLERDQLEPSGERISLGRLRLDPDRARLLREGLETVEAAELVHGAGSLPASNGSLGVAARRFRSISA